MSQRIYESAKDNAKKAVEFDRSGEYPLAVQHYLKAFDLLVSLVKYSDNKRLNEYYAKTAENYLNRVYEIKDKRLDKMQKDVPNAIGGDSDSVPPEWIMKEKPDVRWDEVAGLHEAKRAIQDALILPMKRMDLFEGRESWRGMLLHGPPGCGKTLLAKAAANELDLPFYSLSAADIMDKYVGESEKRIRALFEVARANQPCIAFIDEFDAISSGGSGDSHPVQDRVMSEFAAQMDGTKSKPDDRFLLWAATNFPWKFHERTIRRYSIRVHIPLPDLEARQEIFRINIYKKPKIDIADDVDLSELARLTVGYSGDDIKKLCMDAWYIPIHELVDNGTIDHAMPRKVNRNDFIEALKKRKNSVSPESAQRYKEWAMEWDTR